MPTILPMSFERLIAAQLAQRPDATSKSWLVIHDEADPDVWDDVAAWLKRNDLATEPTLTTLNNEGFAIIEYDTPEGAHAACASTRDFDGRRLRFACHEYGWLDEPAPAHMEPFPAGWPRLLDTNS